MFSKLAVTRNESPSDNTQFYVMMLISLEALIGQSGLRGRCSRKRTKVVYKQVSHAIIFSPRQDLIWLLPKTCAMNVTPRGHLLINH